MIELCIYHWFQCDIFHYYIMKNNFDEIVNNYIVKWLSISGDLVQEWLFVFCGMLYLLQHYWLKEEVRSETCASSILCFQGVPLSFLFLKFSRTSFVAGVNIWFLSIIYFIAGVPGAYVLWYKPLYRAFRYLPPLFYFNLPCFISICVWNLSLN